MQRGRRRSSDPTTPTTTEAPDDDPTTTVGASPTSEPDDVSTTVPSDGDGVALPGLLDDADDPIPDDDSVVTGVLDNGIVYYIRENDNPGAKADLRLAVRAVLPTSSVRRPASPTSPSTCCSTAPSSSPRTS
ncbi:MAG: hypothetical protein R2697_14845 [Ilumatobacteraceae bacterium]